MLANVDRPDPGPAPGPDGSGGNKTGIILGCVAAIIVIIAVTVFCIKRNTAKKVS